MYSGLDAALVLYITNSLRENQMSENQNPLVTANISFENKQQVTQKLEMVADGITENELLGRLTSGEYLTTVGSDADDTPKEKVVGFDETGNEFVVATIVEETIGDEDQTNFAMISSTTRP
jgi:TolB-like protein